MKRAIHNKVIRMLGILAVSVVVGVSCQRVINIDLNTANPSIVIQGYVTDQPGVDTIVITKTGSYFTPGNYPKITNAAVTISDNTGFTDTLVQVDSGVYVARKILGVPGRTYTMKAIISGKEYDGVSAMPSQIVNIDSVIAAETVNTDNKTGVVDSYYRIHVYFQDPPGLGNYYQAQLIVNDTLCDSLDQITLESDEFVDGTEINLRLRGYNAFYNEIAKVNLLTINAGTYNYYEVVRSVAGAGNPVSTAVPQNPPTNIVGGAYGYFSAYGLRSSTITVP